jgi:hypothetical protein
MPLCGMSLFNAIMPNFIIQNQKSIMLNVITPNAVMPLRWMSLRRMSRRPLYSPNSTPLRFAVGIPPPVAGTLFPPTTAGAAPGATKQSRRSTTTTVGGDWLVEQPRVQPIANVKNSSAAE